jgi:AraC family transcriptional regulator
MSDRQHITEAVLEISPEAAARRQRATWTGLTGEIVQITQQSQFESRYQAAAHLLIAVECGERHEGETFVEGLPRSSLRSLGQTLIFVPAGRRLHDWHNPSTAPRLICLYLDPVRCLTEAGIGRVELEPRLFFQDADLWATVLKLSPQIEDAGPANRLYVEALRLVLVHELLRLSHKSPRCEAGRPARLAGWQAKRTTEYIEAHLAERISLAELAAIVRLSPYHFARTFKRTFGMPPHRYHLARRVERAKILLAQPTSSITEIAYGLGFGEASSFSRIFRQFAGRTPSSYRRNLS